MLLMYYRCIYFYFKWDKSIVFLHNYNIILKYEI